MSLVEVEEGRSYIVKDLLTNDDELKLFLLSLGCFAGQNIMLIKKNKTSFRVKIKASRYSIDTNLAKIISV